MHSLTCHILLIFLYYTHYERYPHHTLPPSPTTPVERRIDHAWKRFDRVSRKVQGQWKTKKASRALLREERV
jgi:hypothetical protein